MRYVTQGIGLNREHFHCWSEHGEGGHYHEDTTPDEIAYEAFLAPARDAYKVD